MSSLFLMRLCTAGADGLRLSPVTRKKLEYRLIDYSRALLAQQLIDEKLREFMLQMREFDVAVKCRALVQRTFAADFSGFVDMHEGYSYAGYGPGASGFGYDDPNTVAWVVPHDQAPAVWWRANDPLGSGRVMTWLNRCADDLEDGLIPAQNLIWPDQTDPELCEPDVPEEVLPGALSKSGKFRQLGRY